jgi:hypothetical protein
MTADPSPTRSRRSILAAAAASAAGVTAAHLAAPGPVAAANPPLYINQDNPTSATTSITTNGVNAFSVTTNTQATAIYASGGSGAAVAAVATSGTAVAAYSDALGISVNSPSGTAISSSTNAGTAVEAWASSGAAVLAHVGGSTPTPVAGVALLASVSDSTQVGLRVHGRVQVRDRSGRATVKAGKASVTVAVTGVTSGNYAIATMAASRSNRWVRAVVCSSGKITIYLNGSVNSGAGVNWLVLG